MAEGLFYKIKIEYKNNSTYMYNNGRPYPNISTARGIASSVANKAKVWRSDFLKATIIPYRLTELNDNDNCNIPKGKYVYEGKGTEA